MTTPAAAVQGQAPTTNKTVTSKPEQGWLEWANKKLPIECLSEKLAIKTGKDGDGFLTKAAKIVALALATILLSPITLLKYVWSKVACCGDDSNSAKKAATSGQSKLNPPVKSQVASS